jgi:membrane-associated protease RseP (regulator of RpoE activity)
MVRSWDQYADLRSVGRERRNRVCGAGQPRTLRLRSDSGNRPSPARADRCLCPDNNAGVSRRASALERVGVILGHVYPDGPASRAGLRIGDVVLSVDGKPIENGRQFDVTLYQKPVGSTVTVELERALQRLSIPVQTVERQDRVDRLREMVTPEQNLIPGWGFWAWTSPLIWQS